MQDSTTLNNKDLPSKSKSPPENQIVVDDKHLPLKQFITDTGPKVYDLENLEHVSDDILFKEEFMTAQIMKDLADGKLDGARMQRLKTGFFALMDSL